MSFFKNLALWVVVVLCSYFFSNFFGDFSAKYISKGASFLDLRGIVGLLDAYIFFFPIFFIILGDHNRYWWVGSILTPVVLLNLYVSMAVIYYPIILVIVGFTLGFGLRKLKEFVIKKLAKS